MASAPARRCADLLWKFWYPVLTRLSHNDAVTFLNYGYWDDTPPPLTPEDEPDRACIQLYHRVAGALDGLDVLEISCGHGGGASYVARCLHPRSLTAVDRNPRAVALCQARHHAPNLRFQRANALALPFPDHTFDAILNVEASHCYPDMPRFLREAARVLRPGGHFLYADFRAREAQLPLLRHQLQRSGLTLLTCDDISPQVVRGIEHNSARYLALIRRRIPAPFRSLARRFAGTRGSAIHRELQSGQSVYLACHLRKPAR